MRNGAGSRLVVAVPVKDLTHAKQRLMGALSVAERGELARAMLRDVLRALAAADLDGVGSSRATPRPRPSRAGSAPRPSRKRRTAAIRRRSRSPRPRPSAAARASS
jgi:hypothetical protein